jgi:hypothetical protein
MVPRYTRVGLSHSRRDIGKTRHGRKGPCNPALNHRILGLALGSGTPEGIQSRT